MTTYRSLNHTKWHCQYHVVFIPKYRKKAIYGGLREQLGEVLRQRALHRESRVEDGHLLVDHVHMLVSIPLKLGFPICPPRMAPLSICKGVSPA